LTESGPLGAAPSDGGGSGGGQTGVDELIEGINFQFTKTRHCFFHFCYGANGSLRQTVDVENLLCPWCRRYCCTEDGLVLHLATWHDRCRYQVERDDIGSIDIAAYPSRDAEKSTEELAQHETTCLRPSLSDRRTDISDFLAVDKLNVQEANAAQKRAKAIEREFW
jgi:hypothetical protein